MNVRLFVSALSAFAALLVVSGATASGQREVRLTVSITGNGVVRLSSGQRLRCSNRCHKTFFVRASPRVLLTASPGSGWVLSGWKGACRGKKPSCGLLLRRAANVSATFGPPGSTKANPIPLGHEFDFSGSWVFKVVAASIDATPQIIAIPGNSPPPPGAQYTMLDVAATYTGLGYSSFNDDVGLQTVGAHNVAYDKCNEQLPPPALDGRLDVYSGQSIGGNVCFQIASDDADSLVLRAYDGGGGGYIYFALR